MALKTMNADYFRKASVMDHLWIRIHEEKASWIEAWVRHLPEIDKPSALQEAPWQMKDIPKAPWEN